VAWDLRSFGIMEWLRTIATGVPLLSRMWTLALASGLRRTRYLGISSSASAEPGDGCRGSTRTGSRNLAAPPGHGPELSHPWDLVTAPGGGTDLS
jgi:hypothetical protein